MGFILALMLLFLTYNLCSSVREKSILFKNMPSSSSVNENTRRFFYKVENIEVNLEALNINNSIDYENGNHTEYNKLLIMRMYNSTLIVEGFTVNENINNLYDSLKNYLDETLLKYFEFYDIEFRDINIMYFFTY
jgi:hypothetical protein